MTVSSDANILPVDSSGLAIRGGAIRVAGYAAGVLISLGAAAILVRHLGISSFGRYVTVTSLVALVGGVSEAGIHVFGIREFAARPEADRRQLMATLLAMRLSFTVIGIVLALGFGLVVGYEQALLVGTVVMGVGLLVQVTGDVLSIPLQVKLQLGRLTIVDLVRRTLALVMIAALAVVDATLVPFFVASTLAGVGALALLAWMVRSSLRIRLSFNLQAWRALFADTLPYAIAMSIGAIYFYVTVIVMSLIASAHQAGLFATSFRVIQVALGVPILLLIAVFPLMAHQHSRQDPAVGAMIGKVFTVAVICGAWMSVALALGAPVVIGLIAGNKGHGAIAVLQVQAIVLTMSFVSTSSALGLISLGRYRPMIIGSTTALGLNIILGLALIPSLGAQGGALADVITEALVAIGLTLVVMNAVPAHEISASLAMPVLLACALSATLFFAPIGPVARVLAATIIYFGVLWLLGAIPTELSAAAQGVRRRRAFQ